MQQYKINLHILEPCNYKCKHCFSKFNSKSILNYQEWLKIIKNCEASINVCEYNIAGGEPLLYKDLKMLLSSIDKPISLITNGSKINNDFIENIANHFYMIGISIDSFDYNTNLNIGRCDNNKKTINFDELKKKLIDLKNKYPNCKLKINTVVLQENKNEILWKYIKQLPIDKWKILKSKKCVNETFSNEKYIVNNDEFKQFVFNNLNIFLDNYQYSKTLKIDNIDIVIEPSLNDSYLFIDSNGYLIMNSNDNNEQIIDFKNNIDKNCLSKVRFNKQKYLSRYDNFTKKNKGE